MAAPATNPDLGRADEHGGGDTYGASDSTHGTTTEMPALPASTSTPTPASPQAESGTPQQEDPIPLVLSAIEKEIVAAGMKRVWQFADDKLYDKANYILRWAAQKHAEGPTIWQREFMDPRFSHVRNKSLLVYGHIFSESAWQKLYNMLMEEFPKLKEVQGKTDDETRQNLKLWDEEFDTRGRREFEPEEQAQWDGWIDADVIEWKDYLFSCSEEDEDEEDEEDEEEREERES